MAEEKKRRNAEGKELDERYSVGRGRQRTAWSDVVEHFAVQRHRLRRFVLIPCLRPRHGVVIRRCNNDDTLRRRTYVVAPTHPFLHPRPACKREIEHHEELERGSKR